jgi:hypothetical protein
MNTAYDKITSNIMANFINPKGIEMGYLIQSITLEILLHEMKTKLG